MRDDPIIVIVIVSVIVTTKFHTLNTERRSDRRNNLSVAERSAA